MPGKLVKIKQRPKHGGPYDRGASDYYANRKHDPHYWPQGTYKGVRVEAEQMTVEQLKEYDDGYNKHFLQPKMKKQQKYYFGVCSKDAYKKGEIILADHPKPNVYWENYSRAQKCIDEMVEEWEQEADWWMIIKLQAPDDSGVGDAMFGIGHKEYDPNYKPVWDDKVPEGKVKYNYFTYNPDTLDD
jgi:hypothetical protein